MNNEIDGSEDAYVPYCGCITFSDAMKGGGLVNATQ